MDLSRYPLDLILVPCSLLLTASYHAYVWLSSKAKQPATTIARTVTKRGAWAQSIIKDNKKKGMLGVQSLRNALMSGILSATTAITLSTSMAALANNAYKSNHLLRHAFFGSQEGSTVVLKYASAMLLLLFSFVCNSMAIGFIIDANFLINSSEEEDGDGEYYMFGNQAEKMVKRGCVLAVVGNRVLFVTLPMLLWLFGPVAMALSSVAMVVIFYELDLGGMASFRGAHHSTGWLTGVN